MKYLYTLLLLPLFIFSQEPIDIGIDGTFLDGITFEDNSVIVLTVADKISRMNLRGVNGQVKAYDVKNKKILNTWTDKKGISLRASDEKGNFIVVGLKKDVLANIKAMGDDSKIFAGVVPMSKLNTAFDYNDKTAYDDDGYHRVLINGKFLIIGPKDKGFKLNQKIKSDKQVEWLISNFDIEKKKKTNSSFYPKNLSGKQSLNGHVLISLFDDKFTLLSKTYSNEKLDESDIQNILLSNYDFNGALLEEIKLTFTIDKSKYKYARAMLKGGYIKEWSNNRDYFTPTSASTGTVYYNHIDSTYLFCALLKGRNKNNKAKAIFIKKDADDNEIWKKYVDIFIDDTGGFDSYHTIFKPHITNNKIFYRKKNRYWKNEGNILVGAIDYETGEVDKETKIKKLLGVNLSNYVKPGLLYGREIEGVLPKNVILSSEAILAFGVNEKIQAFLESENPEHKVWYYTHFNDDSSATLLKADYENKVYRIYYFEN